MARMFEALRERSSPRPSILGRRGTELGAALGTLAVLPAVILVLWLTGWYANIEAFPIREDSSAGRIEGRVWKVEPTTNSIHVSAKPLGIGAIRVVLTDDTRVLVGNKEGAFADLREGMRVVVAYEHRDAIRLARAVELVGTRDPRILKTAASD